MIFETHAHFDDKAFDEDRFELLESMNEHGIGCIVNIGASLDSTRSSIELAEKYNFIYAAAGVHPSDTDELDDENFKWLEEQTRHDKVVAVGEIGLDYHWDEPSRDIQQYWFRRQLDLAREVGKPVVIHSREAAKDTMDIMKEMRASDIGGVIHCYSYSLEMAREFVDMGFYIGIGGVVTFKNGKKLQEVAKNIPLDRILLETDCPYLAPEPHRGERNSSLYLPLIAEKIAQLRDIDVDEVISQTSINAKNMYKIWR